MQKIKIQNQTSLRLGLVCFLLLIFSYNLTSVKAEFTQGDTVIWGSGEGRSITGYVKATYNHLSNSSNVFIDFQEFDIFGENQSTLVHNVSMSNYWVSEVNATQYAANNNYDEETVTILEEEVNCVIIERNSGGFMTYLYYDIATGVMVQTINDNDEFIRLISWTNIDVKIYAEELNQGIPGYGLLLFLSMSLLPVFAIITNDRKKKSLRILTEF
jgi:hypothetical protein